MGQHKTRALRWHPPPKKIDDFSVDDMQDLLQLNFISIFAACKYALPHLRKVKGNIINMSSLVGIMGQAEAPTYTATKGACVLESCTGPRS